MEMTVDLKEETCTELDIKLAKKGEKAAFCRLIKKNEDSMYRTAKAILKTDEDCADAIQETIIKAYKSIGKLRKEEFFKTWLIRIVINESYRLLKRKNKLVPVESVIGINENYNFEDENIIIRHAVESLEEELKMVTVLHYFEDLSVRDISEVVNIPEGTVKSRLSRARSKLYEILKIKEEN